VTRFTAQLREVPSRLSRRLSAGRARRQLVQAIDRAVGGRAANAGTGPRVGFATFGSGCWHLGLEVLLAHALALRGARPELLVCDLPDLPVCDERTIDSRDTERCAGCIDDKRALLDAAGIPWRGTSAFVTDDALARARGAVAAIDDGELEATTVRGWPIGQWLHVSACHYLRCDARGESAEKMAARRRLLASAMVTVEAVERWLDEARPDIVIAESGAHFMWRIALELARARGIPVVCREMGKGGWDRHIYALNADAMSPDLGEEWSQARREPLSATEEAEVDSFLDQLPAATYLERTAPVRQPAEVLRRALGISADARVAVAFTNVTWDLATAGRDVAHIGVHDWIRETIQALAGQPLVHLIVRAHPAEASVHTRERILDQVRREWPSGLPRVTLMEPESGIAASGLVSLAELVLVYNSTAGIEAAIGNRPVVLCGAPHYRGKGFTIDVESRTGYARMLAAWARGTSLAAPEGAVALARRYLHLFFLRYHVTMGWTTSPLEPPYRLLLGSLDELRPGENPALDLVCDGILNRRQIVRPRAGVAEAMTWT
jgi:hypothetical protein